MMRLSDRQRIRMMEKVRAGLMTVDEAVDTAVEAEVKLRDTVVCITFLDPAIKDQMVLLVVFKGASAAQLVQSEIRAFVTFAAHEGALE